MSSDFMENLSDEEREGMLLAAKYDYNQRLSKLDEAYVEGKISKLQYDLMCDQCFGILETHKARVEHKISRSEERERIKYYEKFLQLLIDGL